MSIISRTPSIYQIRYIVSGKVYIGSATNPHRRWIEHKSRLGCKTHSSRHLQSAWDKYGELEFVFEIVEPVLFVEDLVAREQYWIDKMKAANPAYGYNMAPLAMSVSGYKHSEETRARASAKKRDMSAQPEVRSRLINQSREYWSKPDSREKMRIKKQRDAANSEIRARMSAAQRARAENPDVRAMLANQARKAMEDPERRRRASDVASNQIYILVDPTGTLHEVRNLKAFCQKHGLVRRCLDYVMQGIRRQHKGWTCRRKVNE